MGATNWKRVPGLLILLPLLAAACGGRACGSMETGPVGIESEPERDFSAEELQRPLLTATQIVEPLRNAQLELAVAVTGVDPLSPAATADRLEMTIGALGETARRSPRGTFDPEAVVAGTGPDPEALLAWVRNETILVPYEGLLRGPVGVLLDRVGNSLDRAVLLVELLRRAGQDVQLARTRLTPDQAAELLRGVRASSIPRRQVDNDPTTQAVDEFLKAYGSRFGVNEAVLHQRLTAVRAAADLVGREAARRTEVQTEALIPVVWEAIERTFESPEPAQLQALTDHWWVQRRRGNDWIDMDPTGIAETLSLQASSTLQPEAISDDARHRLRIRVALECACEERLQERVLIDHTVRLAEVVGIPINLGQFPNSAPAVDAMFSSDPDRGAIGWLSGQPDWRSALWVGATNVSEATFNLRGEVNPSSTTPVDGGTGGFFGALGGGNDEPSVSTDRLTAQMIDYELLTPGRPAHTERRYLVDWIGPEARFTGGFASASATTSERSLDLAIQTEIVAITASLTSEYVAHLTSASLVANSGAVLSALRRATPPSVAMTSSQLSLEPSPDLLTLALARQRWSRHGSRVYVGEANILSRHQVFELDSAGLLQATSAFDIVTNSVDVLNATGLELMSVRTSQGVLDANAELLLANLDAPATNVTEVFVGQSGVRWTAVREPEDPEHRRDARAGELLVVPGTGNDRSLEGAGWWRVDQRTGTVIGITRRGWGGTQALTEFARNNEQQIRTAGIIFRVMMLAHCLVSNMRAELSSDILKKYGSARQAGVAGGVQAALCLAGAAFSIKGIALGGAYGNLMSRIGDMFSIAFNLKSYF